MITATDTPRLPDFLLAEQTHLSVPSLPHWIEATVDYLRQKLLLAGGCHEARAGKVMVALHEALSNAIVHGNLEVSSALKEQGDDAFARALAERCADPAYAERKLDVRIDCDRERCRWVITDQGRGFDVDAVLRRTQNDDPEAMLASGRGILIMCSFLDEVRWELGGRRLVLTLDRESGAEKRRQPRLPLRETLHVAPILPDGGVDWQAAYDAIATDLSSGGVGFVQQRLAESQRVLIGFVVEGRLTYVPAEVRHCRSIAGDLVELGCRFQSSDELEGAEAVSPEQAQQVRTAIDALLARHQQARLPRDERRTDPRVGYNEPIGVELPGGQRLTGYARDLSKGGVAFLCTQPLPLGDAAVLMPQPDARPLRLRVRVLRCVRVQEGFYDIGARFMHVATP